MLESKDKLVTEAYAVRVGFMALTSCYSPEGRIYCRPELIGQVRPIEGERGSKGSIVIIDGECLQVKETADQIFAKIWELMEHEKTTMEV